MRRRMMKSKVHRATVTSHHGAAARLVAPGDRVIVADLAGAHEGVR